MLSGRGSRVEHVVGSKGEEGEGVDRCEVWRSELRMNGSDREELAR